MRYRLRPDANEELIAALFSPYPSEKNTKHGREKGTLLFGVCSVLFTLFAAAGLFLGIRLTETVTSELIAGRATVMNGALFGIMIELVRGSVTLPAAEGAGFAFLPVLLYGAVCALIAVIAVSLVLTILAIVLPRASKQLTFINAYLVLLAYGGLFALTYLALGYRNGALTNEPGDLSAATVAAAVIFLLIVMAAVRKRKYAAANCFLLLLTVLSLFALYFPGTALLSDLNALFSGESALPSGVKISLFALVGLTALNAAVSVFRLNATKRYPIDIIRFGLQTLAVFALIAFSFIADTQSGIFTDQPMALSLLIASSFAALLFSSFITVFWAGKRKSDKP